MNIKLALKPCHDILSNIGLGGYNDLIGGIGLAIFLHKI